MSMFAEQLAVLDEALPLELRGAVVDVLGLAVRVSDLPMPVGAMVHIITSQGKSIDAQVIGFSGDHTLVMPIGTTTGIRRGDQVIGGQPHAMVRVGEGLLGRVVDGMGRAIDQAGPLGETVLRSLQPPPVEPMDRMRIDTPLGTGIRALDSLASVGRGQRLGVFASPGVGKSVLLGMMARATQADVNVIALVGERGREVRDFIEHNLGQQGMSRSVVVVATGDEPPLMRIRAALVATTIAEYFRDQGKDVLLIMDSVTRFCQAQRQVGLAAGEPPATKGYPPSVFSMLPILLERTGRTRAGSITGFYAVLVEGDELMDPIADAARGVLDGHVSLSQRLAQRGHWPAIDVVQTISRCSDDVIDGEHQTARRAVLQCVAAYQEVQDLLNIGAYAPGSNSEFDLAIACKPMIDQLLRQGRGETTGGDFDTVRKQLLVVHQQIEQARQQLAKQQSRPGASGPRAGNPTATARG